MLKKAIENLAKGIMVGEYLVYAKRVAKGRFKEEVNLDLYLKKRRGDLSSSTRRFSTGEANYRPWVELFGINDKLVIGKYVIKYFESKYKDVILSFFSKHIEAGAEYSLNI